MHHAINHLKFVTTKFLRLYDLSSFSLALRTISDSLILKTFRLFIPVGALSSFKMFKMVKGS